jgi:hypothetical protein
MRMSQPRQAAGWVAAACIGFFLLGSTNGCGRKLPPIRPGVFPPPAVSDLTYEVQGGDIFLGWRVPAFDPAKESAPASFKVLRARQATDEIECSTCPMAFQVIADISASGKPTGRHMRFQDTLEPGFKHSYKLQVVTVDDMAGKDSNVVAVTY